MEVAAAIKVPRAHLTHSERQPTIAVARELLEPPADLKPHSNIRMRQ